MSEQEWLECFGDKLTFLLSESGYSQREVAAMAHISEGTLSKYMKGYQVPKGTVIVNLAYALNCDLVDLIDFGDEIVF